MEETIKYFQPDITDIRVGYECQMFDDRLQDPKNINWINVVLDDWEQVGYAIEAIKWRVRVPYLTKEQIEAEGWVETESRSVFKKDKWNLGYAQPFNNPPLIWIRNSGDYIYQGQCKDINTFRYICKLLNI